MGRPGPLSWQRPEYRLPGQARQRPFRAEARCVCFAIEPKTPRTFRARPNGRVAGARAAATEREVSARLTKDEPPSSDRGEQATGTLTAAAGPIPDAAPPKRTRRTPPPGACGCSVCPFASAAAWSADVEGQGMPEEDRNRPFGRF